MKTLIVGGTGGIGTFIARRLRNEKGHEVTIAARSAPSAQSLVADFPFIAGDYVEGTFTVEQLKGFDNLIFAACNDIRQLPPGLDAEQEAAFYRRANSEAVPRFFGLAKEAGIRRTAYIGSFYPQAKPETVGEAGYVRSRLDADEGARFFADDGFHVVSLNAPWVVGVVPGLTPGLYGALTRWALGELPEVQLTAPPGGTNYISMHSLYQAVVGGLEHGENGRGYLIGDENLHFSDFFRLFFEAVGRDGVDFAIRDEEHPILRDMALFAGRAATIFYEPEGVAELGYDTGDIRRAVNETVALVRGV